MKKTTQWLMVAILVFGGLLKGFAQDVKGEPGKWTFIAQLTNPEKVLLVSPTNDIDNQIEVTKENGAFKFTVNQTEPQDYLIFNGSALKNNKNGFSLLVTAVPGEVLTAKGFCNDNKPSGGLTFGGTPFYQDYTKIYALRETVQNTEDAQLAISYAKAHAGSEACALLVGPVGCYDPDRLKELLALMPPKVRNGRMKGYIDSEIAEAKEYVQQKERDEKLPVGSVAPDFTLEDINGQPLSLKSLRGKYLILDFWGSWCGWCIKGFPDMKKYYQKYKDKMEILGMDCNDTKVKWKRAVEEHMLPWKHVYVPKGSDIYDDYRISGFPTKVIISPEGKVVNTVIGEDPMFYDMLDKLFK